MSAKVEIAPAAALRGTFRAQLALATVATVPIIAYVVVALQRIGYAYELTYFEGSTVEVTARVVDGQPLYAAPTTTFTSWPYPPLYFWLTAAVARVVGVNLQSLRLVSFAASLVVLLLLVLIVYQASRSLVAAVVSAGLYAATYRVSGAWADTARVDSLMLAFVLGGILVGLRATSRRSGFAVGAVFFLAFLTKQNALIVAAPLLVYLLVRRRTVGVAATLSLGTCVFGSTLVGHVVTQGWYSRYVFTQLLRQPVAITWLWDFWLQDLLYPFAVAAVVVVLVVVLLRRQGLARPRRGDQAAYLAAAVAGLILASWAGRLHEGGYANVSMPAHAGVAIVLGLLLAALLRIPRVTAKVVAVLVVALAVQCSALTLWRLDVVPNAADRAAGDRFVAAVRKLPGRVLIPTHPYYLRLAGQPTHASAVAIQDLLRSDRGADSLGEQLPWSLQGVSAVILDNRDDAALFGVELTREFTLVTTTFVPDGVFVPLSDIRTHPSLLYVRSSVLRVSAPSAVTVPPKG